MFASLLKRTVIVSSLLLMIPSSLLSETLKQALENAYNNSNELKIQRALIRKTNEEVASGVARKRAKVSINPSVSSGYSFSSSCLGFCNSSTANINLKAEASILDSGRAKLRISKAKESVELQRLSYSLIEQNVLLEALKAFVDLRRNMEFLALERNSVTILEKEVQAAQDRFDVGEITKTDISFAEARLEAAKGKLSNQEGLLKIAKEQYLIAVGEQPINLVAPTRLPEIPETLSIAKDQAAKSHPTILSLKLKSKMSDLDLELARANYNPQIGFSGSISDSSASGKLSSSLSLVGEVVLYNGGLRSSAERSAIASVEGVRIELLHNTRKILQGVANRWVQLSIARALISANEKQIRAAETAYRGVQDEAEFGLRTTLDILDAEQSLMSAKVQLASTKRDEYVAAYELLKAMGLLTAQNLNLNVKQYDITKNYDAVKNAPRNNQFFKLDNLLKRWGR